MSEQTNNSNSKRKKCDDVAFSSAKNSTPTKKAPKKTRTNNSNNATIFRRSKRSKKAFRPSPISYSVSNFLWPKYESEPSHKEFKTAFAQKYKPTLLCTNPPIVQFDEFLTQNQVKKLLEMIDARWDTQSMASPQDDSGQKLSRKAANYQRTSRSMFFQQSENDIIRQIERKSIELIGLSDIRHYLV